MKILKLILILAAIALIVLGINNAFAPVDVFAIDAIATKDQSGVNNQTIGMIGLGVVALMAGALLKNRR